MNPTPPPPQGDKKTRSDGPFFFSLAAVMAMKLWDWMEIERTTVTREIKRLELRIAQLASSLRETGRLD